MFIVLRTRCDQMIIYYILAIINITLCMSCRSSANTTKTNFRKISQAWKQTKAHFNCSEFHIMCKRRLLSRYKGIRVYYRLEYQTTHPIIFFILVNITLDISLVPMQNKIHDTLIYKCGFLFICSNKNIFHQI